MGIERSASYYNNIYLKKYKWKRLKHAPWYPLWLKASWWIECNKLTRVVDVGCGVGPLARFLNENVTYIGYDFSEIAIARAQEEFKYRAATKFIQKDVSEFTGSEFNEADGVVFCEILEHINNDVALLQTLPKGINVFITVPTFNTKSHVRRFPTEDDVFDRYDETLDLFGVDLIGDIHFAVWGTKR